jgi:hypothetical protein
MDWAPCVWGATEDFYVRFWFAINPGGGVTPWALHAAPLQVGQQVGQQMGQQVGQQVGLQVGLNGYRWVNGS